MLQPRARALTRNVRFADRKKLLLNEDAQVRRDMTSVPAGPAGLFTPSN